MCACVHVCVRACVQAAAWIQRAKNEAKRVKAQANKTIARLRGEATGLRERLKKAQLALIKAEKLAASKQGKELSTFQLTNDKELQEELEKERLLEERVREREEEKQRIHEQRQREREERRRLQEQRRLEKKFPVEDTQLANEVAKMNAETGLAIAPVRALPSVGLEGIRSAAPFDVSAGGVDADYVMVCGVAAMVSQFGSALGMEAAAVQAAGTVPSLMAMLAQPGPALVHVYREMLGALLRDGGAHPGGLRRLRRWWHAAMTSEWADAAWPEVAARYLGARPIAAIADGSAGPGASLNEAVRTLQSAGFAGLYGDAGAFPHAVVLAALSDELCETHVVRGVVDVWVEERQEFFAQRREAVGDFRRKRRERVEAQKEEARIKREAKEERRAKRKAERAEEEDDGDDEGGALSDASDDSQDSQNTADAEERFRLPEGFADFTGDPLDRRAVLAHRKLVENEKLRLQVRPRTSHPPPKRARLRFWQN